MYVFGREPGRWRNGGVRERASARFKCVSELQREARTPKRSPVKEIVSHLVCAKS